MGVGGASREAGWLLARMTVHDNVHAVHAILLITVPMVPGNTLGAREDVRGVILLCGPQPTCHLRISPGTFDLPHAAFSSIHSISWPFSALEQR